MLSCQHYFHPQVIPKEIARRRASALAHVSKGGNWLDVGMFSLVERCGQTNKKGKSEQSGIPINSCFHAPIHSPFLPLDVVT